MTRARILLAAGMMAVTGCSAPGMEQGPVPGPVRDRGIDTVHVEVRGSTFEPRVLRVTAGTVVVWTNHDPFIHTASSNDGAWGSPALQRGETFTHRFDEPGEFAYRCLPHPVMSGTVLVGPVQDGPVEASPTARRE